MDWNLRRLCGVLLAALVVACDGHSVALSPTAPPVPPSVPPPDPPAATSGSFLGPVTILGAGPAGDCVGDRLAQQAGSQLWLELGLERAPDGSWVGTYYSSEFFGVSGGCSAYLVGSGGGYLDLELYPYCDFSLADWAFAADCTPRDQGLVAGRLHLPEPSGEPVLAIQGEGTILVRRYPETLPPLELWVRFDLKDATAGR